MTRARRSSTWFGYRQIGIRLERGARYDSRPRVRFTDLWRLAKSAIVSFSYLPLTIFYGIALIATFVFVALAAFTVYHKLVTGLAILGWTSTVMTACFFGAVNALGIAILGEYVLRIYDQVRARPVFIVERSVNFAADAEESVSHHELPVGQVASQRE
jgi:dolichol-phosphate mannosyltransferase